MKETAELAGFFAAHAIWCLGDGGPFIPIYASEQPDGSRKMERLMVEDSGQAFAVGNEKMEARAHKEPRGVLVIDAIIDFEGESRDALIIEAVSFAPTKGTISIVVPYAPKGDGQAFHVYPALLNGVEGFRASASSEIMDPFFAGVASHEKGSVVWDEHFVESGQPHED